MNILENKFVKNCRISTKKLFTIVMAIGVLAINPLMLFPQKTLAQSLDNQIDRVNRLKIVLPIRIPATEIIVKRINSGESWELAGELLMNLEIEGEIIQKGSIVRLGFIPINKKEGYLTAKEILTPKGAIPIQAESSQSSPIKIKVITEKTVQNAISEGANTGQYIGSTLATLFIKDNNARIKFTATSTIAAAAINTFFRKKTKVLQFVQGSFFLDVKDSCKTNCIIPEYREDRDDRDEQTKIW